MCLSLRLYPERFGAINGYRYDYLLNLPDDIASAGLVNRDGQTMTSLGEVVNNAMTLIEEQSEQLTGVLPKSYIDFSDELLSELRGNDSKAR